MRIGVCIAPDAADGLAGVGALGGTAISIPIRYGADQRPLLEAAKGRDYAVLGVLDGGSFPPSGTRRDATGRAFSAVARLADQGLISALAVGREWDDGYPGAPAPDDPLARPRGGVGSWVLSSADLAELLMLAGHRLPGLPILVGGICSGHAEVLAGLDLGRVDGVVIHPYGAGMGEAGLARLGAHLDAVAALIAQQGHGARVPMLIGELGLPSGVDVPVPEAAGWAASRLAYLARRRDVRCVFVATDGAEGPIGDAVRRVAGTTDREPLVAGRPDPEIPDPDGDDGDDDEDAPDWADRQFTAEGIGGAIGVDAAAVRALWPWAEHWLEASGIAESVPAKAALLATIAGGTGRRFAPVTEEGSYDRCERLYGKDTPAGAALGNRYHGDGFRYRRRGLVPIRGRAVYAELAARLGLPLEEEPALLTEPAVALGALFDGFARRDLFGAAERGDHFRVCLGVDPSRNGYRAYVADVEALMGVGRGGPGDEPVDTEKDEQMSERTETLAELAYTEQRKLEALGPAPQQPKYRDPKAAWTAWGERISAWAKRAEATVESATSTLGGLGDELVALGNGDDGERHDGAGE